MKEFNTPPSVPIEPSPEVAAAEPAAIVVPPAAKTMRCVQHRNIETSQQCAFCGAYMCSTCEFVLPDASKICPACATKPRSSLGPRRKSMMIWSYVCAAFATITFIVLIGVFAMQQNASEDFHSTVGTLLMLTSVAPGLIGAGLGFAAIDRRLLNPISLWCATVWNLTLLGVFLILTIIGLMR